jgi:hypothetical protein
MGLISVIIHEKLGFGYCWYFKPFSSLYIGSTGWFMRFNFLVVTLTLQPFSLKKAGLKAIILFLGLVLSDECCRW